MITSFPTTREQAVQYARQILSKSPVFLDTETTGLNRGDEIVEISIVDQDGGVLFNELVRPSRPIPPDATSIHHITTEMVQQALPWPVLWSRIRPKILGRPIGIYNAEFDLRMMAQSMTTYRLPWRENLNAFCILELYSAYRGAWDPNRRGMKRFSLETARQEFGIPIPNSHRALDDTLLARAVLHKIAGVDAV